MSKKDIIDELNTISADLILKQDDPFTAGTISRGVTEIETLRERVRELESGQIYCDQCAGWMVQDDGKIAACPHCRAEAAEAKVAEYQLYLEQHPRHLLNALRAAEAKLAAVRGLFGVVAKKANGR